MAGLNKLRIKISLMTVLLLAGLSALTLTFVSRVIDQQSKDAIRGDLANTRRVFEGLLKERRNSMRAQALVLADSVQFKTVLDDKVQDPATTLDVAQEKRAELSLDLFQVAGRKGSLLASLGLAGVQALNKGGSQPGSDTYFVQAADPSQPLDFMGSWAASDGLYETYTRPVLIRGQVLGALRIGFALGDDFAKALRDQTGSEVAVVMDGKVLACSLKVEARQELAASLGALQSKGSSGTDFSVDLDGHPWLGQFIPLLGPDGKPVAQILQLRSLEKVLHLLSSIRQGVIAVLLGLLALGVVLSLVFAASITRPLNALLKGTRAVEKGDLDYRIAVSSGDELGELAKSFNEMIGDLREKERVKALFGRYLPKAVADRAMEHRGEIALGGEQKDVAILFSDIRGFTSLSERLSPPEVVSLLNDYYTRMIDVLFEHDGTLDKTIGDAIMALFGAPVNDAEAVPKALRTALGMQKALAVFNEERQAAGQETIQIGIGINTGIVVAGNLGSIKQLSYTVIGDEVNLASRMCSNAKAGQILVTEAVYRKAKWGFELKALEPIKVKNVSQPVQIYEVLGERATTQNKTD